MRPNLVLLTIDSLRADFAAPECGLMPEVKSLATDGVRFSRCHTNGYSTPISFPTLLTGTYADEYGGWKRLADDRPGLAALLSEAGYETAAVHTNPLIRAEKNYDRGFDSFNDFDDEAGQLSKLRYFITQNLDNYSLPYRVLRRLYHFIRTSSGSADYAQAPKINARALDWLDQQWSGDYPFFLWTHYMDVHYPFYPPGEFLDRDISTNRAIRLNGKMQESPTALDDEEIEDLRALYRGDVRYMDYYVGELLRGLEERDALEETVIVLTSDHGELFGEHGLFGHPPSPYNESVRIPLVLSGPGLPHGKQSDVATSLIDVPPTIAELLDVPRDSRWSGEGLMPVADGHQLDDRDFFIGSDQMLAYQADGWRLAWWREAEHPTDPECEWELLDADRGESVSLDDHPDTVKTLKGRLTEFVDRVSGEERLEGPDVDRATQQRLEALGYK